MSIEELTPAWVITDNGFTDYACEEHAAEYARENGIPPVEGYPGFSLTREGYGIVADVYPVQSWDGYETDYPVACQCGQYLDNVRLTTDGRDYMRENEFPAWLMAAYGIESTQHNEYPHEPGYLYDCQACESSCHCTPGHTECVYEGEHNGLAAQS